MILKAIRNDGTITRIIIDDKDELISEIADDIEYIVEKMNSARKVNDCKKLIVILDELEKVTAKI